MKYAVKSVMNPAYDPGNKLTGFPVFFWSGKPVND
jgi:hypothetical protein